jgi:hypothetical protein
MKRHADFFAAQRQADAGIVSAGKVICDDHDLSVQIVHFHPHSGFAFPVNDYIQS